MKKLFILPFLLAPVAFVSPAFAQEAEHAEHTGDGVIDEHAEVGGEHAAAEHGHGDPTVHYNFLGYDKGKLFDYKKKDAYGGPLGDGQMVDPKSGAIVHEEEPGSPPFVLMLLNFGLLMLILAKYGGPVAKKVAQERHDQIKTALDDAAKLRKAAADKLGEYETRIKDVDTEVKKLVDGIRADAEADKKRILEAAAAQSAQMKKDAEQRIAAEIELARAALTKEVSVAAATATEKMLREKTTADDQNKLVSTFISNVASSKEAR